MREQLLPAARAFWGAARAEAVQLARSKFLVALAVAQAVTFLVLVSLFGITGARAPTAFVDQDHTGYSLMFLSFLKSAHHSFDLRPMDEATAMREVEHGNLVAVIIVPHGFSDALTHRSNTTVKVIVDNINTDMTEDIQRALPSAIVTFGRKMRLPGVHLRVAETDLIPHDTDFIPYLVVSALISASFIISGILAAAAAAREYETGTGKLLKLAPVHQMVPLLGRVFASGVVSLSALLITAALAVYGYGISPLHPLEMAFTLVVCTVIFSCAGMALGIAMRRTLPVASVIFGMSLPLFLVSGSYEPERFDGNLIWAIAHCSPVYYAVGIMEHAALGLQVTPEPVVVNFMVLLCWAALALLAAAHCLKRETVAC